MSRRITAWDTETSLIRPGLLAPPLVCVTWQSPGEEAQIEHHSTVEPRLRAWLEEAARGELVLVGQNIAFDLAVVAERFPHLRPLIFAAYDANCISDTMIRQWLLDNAAGMFRGRIGPKGKWIQHEYTLEALAKRAAGMQLAKDAWRLSYSNFINVPLNQWVEHARSVQADARITLRGKEAELASLETIAKSRRERGENARVTGLTKEIEGLREMIASAPEQCLKYPLDDARATLAVFLAQEKHVTPYLADQHRQAMAYFALYLNSAWGLRTDEQGVDVLRRATQAELDEIEEDLKMLGLVRADGSRDTKLAKARMIDVCKRDGLALIRTDAHEKCPSACTCGDPTCKLVGKPGHAEDFDHPDFCHEHVCLDADACEASEDDVLIDYAKLTQLKKVLSNDIEALAGGILYPVHTRYGFAATGRTTSSKPNIQNQSKREGIREAFIARPGKIFAECDFPSLELYTLAQCCVSWLGKSRLAEALNGGLDPHLAMAASILKMPYDEAKRALKDGAHPQHGAVKKMRQLSKPANFGFPGGMGIAKFISSTRKSMGREAFQNLFGATVDEQHAVVAKLKTQWLEAWPEMQAYFSRVETLCDTETGRSTVETLFTGRIRGNATFCATANNGFQALGSDCAKRAGWLIAKAQYVGTPSKWWADQYPGEGVVSPLFNGRACAMVHDEFISEVNDNETAHDAAYEQAALMVEGANTFLPDVPIPFKKMEPVLMHRWSKNAESRFDDAGRLVAWKAAA